MLCLRAQLLPSHTDEDESSLFYNIGLLQYHLHDWTSALQNFGKFVNRSQNTDSAMATAFHYIGVLHRHRGDFRRSYEYLLKSVTLESNSCETWYALAKLMDDSDDLESALRAYEEALQHSDENSLSAAMILVDIGRIHHARCTMDDSVSVYKKALRIIRRQFGESSVYAAKLLNIIGMLCVEQGYVNQAMSAFTDAMRILPDVLAVHHRLPCPRHPHAAAA